MVLRLSPAASPTQGKLKQHREDHPTKDDGDQQWQAIRCAASNSSIITLNGECSMVNAQW
jgi:hypothetical protein